MRPRTLNRGSAGDVAEIGAEVGDDGLAGGASESGACGNDGLCGEEKVGEIFFFDFGVNDFCAAVRTDYSPSFHDGPRCNART